MKDTKAKIYVLDKSLKLKYSGRSDRTLKPLVKLLIEDGHEVINENQPLSLNGSFDLAILHPTMDGVPTCYRFSVDFPEIPIIFHSGYVGNLDSDSVFEDLFIDNDGTYFSLSRTPEGLREQVYYLLGERK